MFITGRVRSTQFLRSGANRPVNPADPLRLCNFTWQRFVVVVRRITFAATTTRRVRFYNASPESRHRFGAVALAIPERFTWLGDPADPSRQTRRAGPRK